MPVPDRAALTLRLRGRDHTFDRMRIMGVVNANPDSFSDAWSSKLPQALGEQCDRLVGEGADILDIGGQSAITGREPVEVDQEMRRVVPLVEHVVRHHPDTLISVDTYKAPVAEAALAAGAHIINDVSGLADPRLAMLCAEHQAALVLMHTSAPPLVRLQDPGLHDDVTDDVVTFLRDRMDLARDQGLDPQSIVLDPGPDFTKTPHQTLTLLRGLEAVERLERPVLLALSRKDFLGAITGRSPRGREAATHAAIAFFAAKPGLTVRVHDVAAARDVIETTRALAGLSDLPRDYALPDALRHEAPAG